MRIWNTVEYLLYLAIFLLYFQLSEMASIDINSTSTLSSVDVSTTTERTLRNAPSSSSSSSSSGSIRGTKLKRTLEECKNSFSWMCVKLQFVRFLETLTERQELRLMNGISIVKDPNAKEVQTSKLVAEIARSYPNDPDARLNGYIVNKIYNFLQTHYMSFRLVDDQIIEEARSLIGTGRKDKFGKKGGMEFLLAAALIVKGTLTAMGMGGIALIASKALITALMALTMAAVLGLKSFTDSSRKSHTYEIVTKPIYTSSHSHSVMHDDAGHGGYIGHSGSGYGVYDRTLNTNLPHNLRDGIRAN